MAIIFSGSAMGAIAQTNADLQPPGRNLVESEFYNAAGTSQNTGFINGLQTSNAVAKNDRRTAGLTFVGQIADDNFDDSALSHPTAGGTSSLFQLYIKNLALPNSKFYWL